MCGDDVRLPPMPTAERGRPPRVRGRQPGIYYTGGLAGKTPACAGTTGRPPRASSTRAEDPRVCGDDLMRLTSSGPQRGRPPRVRGRPRDLRERAPGDGKTPACAGTTVSAAARPTDWAEDPRVCGDDGPPCLVIFAMRGRPPRVRGRPPGGRPQRTLGGKTPACAGTTTTTAGGFSAMREDPRVCGDDLTSADESPAVLGRPPRVRGRPVHDAVAGAGSGKTPACAGTTEISPSCTPPTREDPRVCGDDGHGYSTRWTG